MRLDVYLVEKKCFESRARAKMEIEAGSVVVNGKQITKPAFNVEEGDNVEINARVKWVSRGGLKLERALKEFDVDVKDKVVLDIGSSTGGFSDVVLTGGARRVYCVDTGRDILHQKIRSNPKVQVFEQTDYRNLDVKSFESIDIVVIDVSFISLEKIIPKLAHDFACSAVKIVSLIKPQFEVGKNIAKKYKGIIKDPALHRDVLNKITDCFKSFGFECKGIVQSPILGGDGNKEFLGLFCNKKD